MSDGQEGSGTVAAVKSPPVYSDSKPYDRWVNELKFWRKLTKIDKKQQGIAVALSLPEGSIIRDKVFGELELHDLDCDDGLDKLITFLDKVYKKDDLTLAFEVWSQFYNLRRGPADTMESYVRRFEQCKVKLRKFDITLPDPVLAFQLLECSNLPHKDRQLILTGVDYAVKGKVFEQMMKSLLKFFGDQVVNRPSGVGLQTSSTIQVKSEPVLMLEEAHGSSSTATDKEIEHGELDAVYYATQSNGKRYYTRNYRGGRTEQNFRRNPESMSDNQTRKENPMNAYGKISRCRICGSKYHYAFKCPDKEYRTNLFVKKDAPPGQI